MATLQTLGVDSLSLRGAGTEYNSLSRVFKTKAEADAALASGDWTPVAGRMNLCVTGDQGVLRVDENGALVTADDATRAYIDAEITRIVGDAPAVLDSLGELSDAISDDPDFFATMASANTTLQEAINTEVSRATAAEQAIQNDVDANETAANTAIAAEETRATAAEAAIQADVDQNEADADAAIAAEEARALAAEAAIQADVDANEASANADIAAEAARAGAAEAAIQADVDQNEADADAAIAAVAADLVTEENARLSGDASEASARQAADNTLQANIDAVQADVDQNEADADAAIATERARIDAILAGADADKDTFAEIVTLINSVDTANDNAFAAYVLSNDAAVAAVQADVDQNEADADAAIADILDGATFTGDIIVDEGDGPTIKLETSQGGNAGIVMNGASGTYAYIDTTAGFGNDSLQIYSANAWVRAINGGTGNLIVDGTLTLAGTALTATFAELNFVDGVTSNIQTQLDAIQADVDQNESDADAADAALSARLDTLEADPTTATALAAVQADVDQNEADADAAIAVERGRIDAILAGADADKDTFAEIVTLINSVDTANDNAFAAYVLSNDAAVAAVQADVDQNEADADAAIALKLDASAVSAYGLTLVDDADAATARTTLGLGTAATTDATAYATAAQGDTADAALAASAVSAFGLTLVDDADAAAARTTLGLGSAATTDSGDYATAAQGATADAALPAAGAQAALSVDHLITLSGVAEAADDLGTFSGSTISDSGTVKAALQELETALETKAPDADLTTLEGTVDNISGGVTSTTYEFDSGTSAEPGNKDIRFNNTTPANVTEIYISKTNKAGVDLSNVIPEMLFAGVRIYMQNETDASQYLAATITSVTEVNNTYTLGVNEVSAGSLIANNKKTAFAVIGKTPLDLGTFTGSTISDNATPKEALQELETAVELRALLDGTNIPGPYNNDSDAGTAGVAVGAIYKNSNGSIHWRVS